MIKHQHKPISSDLLLRNSIMPYIIVGTRGVVCQLVGVINPTTLLIAWITQLEISAYIALPALASLDVKSAIVACGQKSWCTQVVKVVQQHHSWVFCSAESVILVPTTLAKGEKCPPRIKEAILKDIILVICVSYNTINLHLKQCMVQLLQVKDHFTITVLTFLI